MDTDLRFLPEAASTGADQADQLYIFLVCVATFFTLLIFVLIVSFVYRYRKGSQADRTLDPQQSHWVLEATWTLIPLGLTMIMFAWGADLFFKLHDPPPEGLEVNVVAKQWMWKIQHPGGKRGDQRAACSHWQPRQAADDFRRRDSQLFRPGLSHEAGRPARQVYVALV